MLRKCSVPRSIDRMWQTQSMLSTQFQDGKNKKPLVNMDLMHYTNTSTLIAKLAFLRRTLRRAGCIFITCYAYLLQTSSIFTIWSALNWILCTTSHPWIFPPFNVTSRCTVGVTINTPATSFFSRFLKLFKKCQNNNKYQRSSWGCFGRASHYEKICSYIHTLLGVSHNKQKTPL